LVELFEDLFDPKPSDETRRRDAQAAAAAVAADIDALVSLDTDRVLRAFASMIQATLRTNYFVGRSDSARQQNVLSVKLNPGLIDELPLPRPRFEIFVYSPRVEGCTCGSGSSDAAACGGRIAARTSAPKSLASSRRRR
jgi:glutamate dehydrogenase